MIGRSDTHQRGQASEKAIEAATAAQPASHVSGTGCDRILVVRENDKAARVALAAAHDPALGEDRSVRLGDVLDVLRWATTEHGLALVGRNRCADLLAREFGAPDAR